MRVFGPRLIAAIMTVIALAACGSSSGGGGGSAASLPDKYVGRYVGGAALLAWTNTGGRLAVTIAFTHADPANPAS
ncbi:MAG: hypothetical protein JOZ99_06840, partial [Actinobacteria bacterium]|nr:hypothetical protein [Actinomycetota bacterium]